MWPSSRWQWESVESAYAQEEAVKEGDARLDRKDVG